MRSSPAGFWYALEAVSGLAAVDAEWKAQFGTDYGFGKPFLRPTSKLASSYPCTVAGGCGCEHEVVIHAHEDIVAVCRCERGCETFRLKQSDIVVYELNRPALDAALAKTFGLVEETHRGEELRGTTRIGVYSPHAGFRFPIYLTIQIESHDFNSVLDGLLARNEMPFILLSPTRTLCSPEGEKRLTDKRSIFVPLSENVAIGKKQQIRLLRPATEILGQIQLLKPVYEAGSKEPTDGKAKRLKLTPNEAEQLNEKIVEMVTEFHDSGKGSWIDAFQHVASVSEDELGYRLTEKTIEGRYNRNKDKYN